MDNSAARACGTLIATERSEPSRTMVVLIGPPANVVTFFPNSTPDATLRSCDNASGNP